MVINEPYIQKVIFSQLQLRIEFLSAPSIPGRRKSKMRYCGSNFWVYEWNLERGDHSKKSYFPDVLFIMMYKVVLTFESVYEILKCDHSNKSYWEVLSCGTVYYAVQGGSNFWVCGWNPQVWPFKRKLLSSTFLWCCLSYCTRWF